MNPNLIINHTYDVIEVEQVTTELIEFLNKTFGPPGLRWFYRNSKIYFRDERDYMWFELAT
jgi:hypothetical protein